MNRNLMSRLENIEVAARGRLPVPPALVVMPRPEGGFTACGQHFHTAEEALAAYPDMQPRVVIRIVDSRRHEA
jgi:hypothetical protein